jgi:hypothetical protein
VADRPSNSAPRITSSPVTKAAVETPYSYDVEAADANNDTLYFRLVNKPSGMTIDLATGLIAWTPSASQAGSQYVKVEVVDSKGGKTSQSFYIMVSKTAVSNNPPVISSTPVTAAMAGRAYSYDVNAADADGDTLSYRLSTAPSGMVMNSGTGLITWTPTTSQTGSFDVAVEVVDGNGGSDTQSFTVTVAVAADNQPPVFTSTPVLSAPVKKYYVYDVNAVDPEGDTIKYSLAKKPDGMYINSSTGLIYWYASSSGSYNVSVKATDSKGNSAYQNFTIAVGTASGGVSASSVSPCDVTGDGLVTIADILKIITGRGTDDISLDIDGDGEVTLHDSRNCLTELQN